MGHSRSGITKHRGWHPSMSPYLLGERDGGVWIPHAFRERSLLRAAGVLQDICKAGGYPWLVNTSPQLAPLVITLGYYMGDSMGYSAYGWTPGTLTNWRSVSRSIVSYGVFREACGDLIQREQLEFPRYTRIHRMYQGLVTQEGTPKPRPDILVVLNPNAMPRVLEEASRMHIPTIGLVDTDTPSTLLTYPICLSPGLIPQVYTTLISLVSIVPRK
nr:30S ribosomal protein S2 [Picochlorum sp. 'soloecismus']